MTPGSAGAPRAAASIGLVLTRTVVVAAPGVATVLVLALTGALEAWLAVVIAVVSLGITFALIDRHFRALTAVVGYARDLASGATPGRSEPPGAELARDLYSLIGQMKDGFDRREVDLKAAVTSTETVLDSLPDPLLMLSADRRITRANAAATRLLGRGAAGAALAGKDLAAIIRDPALLEAVDGVLDGGRGGELQISPSMPHERQFRVRVQPLAQATADGSSVIVALHDVTALTQAERTRADFVANASHELRTPLASLIGFIETLQGPARDDAEARERFLGIMHEQAQRMARLIRDLLSLSRAEMNSFGPVTEAADLGRVLESAVDEHQMRAAERGIHIRLLIDRDLPRVMGAADELTQIFSNLMDNAVKYGRPDTTVDVTAHVTQPPSSLPELGSGPVICVAVRDHGEGIPAEHIPRLTERFYRIDTARSRSLGGTGLGLAIVKSLVNRQNGAMVIDSEVGVGSVFSVYLPAVAVPAPV